MLMREYFVIAQTLNAGGAAVKIININNASVLLNTIKFC